MDVPSKFTEIGAPNNVIPEILVKALSYMGFTEPTPIQMDAIPLALAGRDILGSAQTGTGKTAAFGIPAIAYLLNNPGETALVVTPTRELATQVAAAMKQMIPTSDLHTALLIGGEPMPRQYSQLNQNPRLIVGTPGRINDHLKRGRLKLNKTSFLVMDEADRMLDMGFGIQIDEILGYMPPKRQTLLFSATLTKAIVSLSSKYLTNPERIAIGSTNEPLAKIKQDLIHSTSAKKYTHLLAELEARNGSVIIFVKTKFGTQRLADRLCKEMHTAEAIHGDLQQRRRDRVIKSFRDKKYRILVATDVAARGLDIPHIEHVINYDLPQCPEDYIHRIGRTARAGASGSAVNLITPEDTSKWNAIDRLIQGKEPEKKGSSNKKPRRSFKKKFTGKDDAKGGNTKSNAKPRRSFKGPKRAKAA